MKSIYECSVEALDYGENPNAITDLKEMLSKFPDIKIIDTIIEDGDPITDHAGAGVICEVPKDKYKEIDKEYRKLASKVYDVDPMFYRLGLSISSTILI